MIAEGTSGTQTAGNSTHGVGNEDPFLLSSPKDGPQIRKSPSLSTSGVARQLSQTSVHALAALVAQLPRENRDLLYTLVELINATANKKQTKMPLANLLLVFCPSLNIKLGLLRALCESEDVWKIPPRNVETRVQSDAGVGEKSEVSQPPPIPTAVQSMQQQEPPQTPTRSGDPSLFPHVEPERGARSHDDSPTEDDRQKECLPQSVHDGSASHVTGG